MKPRYLLAGAAGIALLAACQTPPADDMTDETVVEETIEVETVMDAEEDVEVEAAVEAEMAEAAETVDDAMNVSDSVALAAALAMQPEEVQARYDARNPGATLEFFGIEPGMTVVEALPGRGWYSKILLPYLGPEGKLIGAHYPDEMWIRILPGADEERVAGILAQLEGWVETAEGWAGEKGAKVYDYKLTTLPEDKAEKADAALFIRALHNLNRTEEELGTYTATIAETYRILKPGGVVGVVQHRASEDTPDAWADGNAGYLKTSFVVDSFEAAGFVLEESSEINSNPADDAGEGDIVWRLAPSFATTEEGTPEREAIAKIGESDRMTLRFRKPE
ncbi:class I SAM-dependent methyltransferase [Hyphomonas atlantica]|nr:class I SAM-dependent methyltransferase [Hyphomonas atlantica]HAE93261.1 methyltransferase [Hyphomonas atlantica]